MAIASPVRQALGLLLLAGWAGVAGAAAAPAARIGPAPLHGFNFAYVAQGARDAAPTQIFDDGHRTYLQFNALDRVPEIWLDDDRGRAAPRRLPVHLESPYIVVDQVAPRLRLVLEGQDTLVVNQGWKLARIPTRPTTAARVWSDTTLFGPAEPPGPIASAREAAPSLDRVPPAAGNNPRDTTYGMPAGEPLAQGGSGLPVDDSVIAPAPALDARSAEAQLEERQRAAAGSLIDARLELLRRAATDLLEQTRRENNLAAAQSVQLTLDTIVQAQSKLLLSQSPARTPGPGKQHPTHGPLFALADTRMRGDLEVRDDVVHDDVLRSGGAAALLPSGLPASRGETGLAGAGGPALQRARGDTVGAGVPLVFEVRDNQRLSQALAHFLETQGWRLEWESASDFVVRRGYTVRGESLKQILLDALGEYRLSAVLYGGNLVVAVSGGER